MVSMPADVTMPEQLGPALRPTLPMHLVSSSTPSVERSPAVVPVTPVTTTHSTSNGCVVADVDDSQHRLLGDIYSSGGSSASSISSGGTTPLPPSSRPFMMPWNTGVDPPSKQQPPGSQEKQFEVPKPGAGVQALAKRYLPYQQDIQNKVRWQFFMVECYGL